jgi:hypothetical protein
MMKLRNEVYTLRRPAVEKDPLAGHLSEHVDSPRARKWLEAPRVVIWLKAGESQRVDGGVHSGGT